MNAAGSGKGQALQRSILLRGPRYVADSGTDVCSRQATGSALLHVI
jgi:hypothetical protein